MELKAGYKQTEIGVIPEDWNVLPLENFTSFISYGFTNPMPFVSSGIALVTAKDVNYGKVQYDSVRFTTEFAYQKLLTDKSRPKKNDLLLTKDGTLGRLAVVDETTICINQSVAILRPNKQISPLFFKLLLESPKYQRCMLDNAGGSTIKHIYITVVNKMLLGVPNCISEQNSIATALSDVDALLAKLDALIAKKRDLKQAAMQQLLTAQTRLPGFSGEWNEKTFGEIFDYLPTATNARSDLSDQGDAYYIHYGDIHTKFHSHIDFQNQKPSMIFREKCKNAALIQNGDWVMADASEDYDGVCKSVEVTGLSIGEHAVAGLHTFLLREKKPTFALGFKGHLGNLASLHQQFLRVATGMKVFGVSKAALKDLVLRFPTLEEQTAIAAILSDMDAEITTLETRRDKTRTLKQGMMQALLTGRIRLV